MSGGWVVLVLRIVFGCAFVLALLGALAGILLTGPVLVGNTRVETGISASPAQLRATVEKLCSDLAPRSHDRPDRLDATAEWIAERMRETGNPVTFQEYRVGDRLFRNVIVRRQGQDPGAETIVFGAHYDAWGGHPGADDNASGVAVLLELLRTLPDHPRARTHLFAAFATEEPPFFGTETMGSYALARQLDHDNVRVGLMIALDMVGYYSDVRGSQSFPFPGLSLAYPDRGNFVAVVGDLWSGKAISRVKHGMMAVDGIPVHSFRASPAWAPVHLSDHWSFRQFDMPAVQVTDTAFMRFPHYHDAGDVPELLDYDRMARLVEALHGVLLE